MTLRSAVRCRPMSIDLRLGTPQAWEYMVGGEPQTWWRVPVHNRKDPVDVTVRVTGIEPEVRLIVPDCRLHRMGDDPPDEKYAGETRLKHNEQAWFDVITMSPKAPGHQAVVVSSSSGQFDVTWSGGKRWPLPVEFCFRTVDRPYYRMPVELDGSYRITLTAHFGSKSVSKTYALQAVPGRQILSISE